MSSACNSSLVMQVKKLSFGLAARAVFDIVLILVITCWLHVQQLQVFRHTILKGSSALLKESRKQVWILFALLINYCFKKRSLFKQILWHLFLNREKNGRAKKSFCKNEWTISVNVFILNIYIQRVDKNMTHHSGRFHGRINMYQLR